MSDEEQSRANFCPTCGTQVADAKFCPECGTDLSAVRRALRGDGPAAPAEPSGKTTGGRRASGGSGPGQLSASPQPAPGARARGIPPWILIGGAVVALAIIIVVVVVGMSANSPSGSASSSSSTDSASPVPADTSGTYAQLVTRANGLYDQGSTAFSNSQWAQSANYFGAAAKIYQAAWKKKAGDPGVGTDWATSVFYSGDIQGALAIVEMVLAKNPSFQPALYNKGNFLAHQAQLSDPTGKSADAKKLNAQAKTAYQQAAAVDPKSDIGKQAAAAAAAL